MTIRQLGLFLCFQDDLFKGSEIFILFVHAFKMTHLKSLATTAMVAALLDRAASIFILITPQHGGDHRVC